MTLKKVFRFAVNNYFISIFVAVIIFVIFVSTFKLFFSKKTYIYAKVKVGQGLWWANTSKPSVWMVQALKKNEIETDLTGNPIAEVLEVRSYPWWNSDQFETYVTLKLKVTGNKKTGKYTFKRSTIAVGSPIDLEFPSVQVSGTILELSEQLFKDKYVEKTISLIKRNGYSKDAPFTYEEIKLGDKFFDGTDTVFEILNKQLNKNIITVSNNLNAQIYEREIETTQTIEVKAKIKLREKEGRLFYGEEYLVKLGKTLNVSTPNYAFTDYTVEKIE